MLRSVSDAERRGSQAFLAALGVDWHDPYMVRAVTAWFRQESGGISRVIGNNPFNIRPGVASSISNGTRPGGVGVFLTFSSLNRGFTAAAMVLKELAPRYGYGTVVTAARRRQAIGFLAALANSSWDAAHYGCTPATARTRDNHLVNVYKDIPL
jgi:hypothetical protein